MSRPAADSLFPYSRSAVASIAGVSPRAMGILQEGKVLKKRARGTGNWYAYSADDLLRIMLAKELTRLGLQVATIHSLFESIQTPTVRQRPRQRARRAVHQ
jgi:DNA-binding transcriptional MerR regulator